MELLSIIGRRWWVVVLFVLLGTAGGAIALLESTPTYQADSQLLLTPVLAKDGSSVVTNEYVVARAEAYASIVSSGSSRVELLRDLQRPAGSRYPEVFVSVVTNTTLVSVTAIDTTSTGAQQAAAAVDSLIVAKAGALDGTSSGGAELKTSVASSPIRPLTSASPDVWTVVGVGTAIGLILGLGFAYAAARFSRRIVSRP